MRPAEEQSPPCAVCGHHRAVPLLPRRNPRHVACVRCGLVYRSPRPTEAAMMRFYEREYYEQGGGACSGRKAAAPPPRGLTSPWSPRAIALSEWLGPHVRPGWRVVEVGCGIGENIARIRHDHGCEVAAVEPSEMMAAHARSAYGLEVVQGGLADIGALRPPFDAIVLSHVLEHFHDPEDTLRRCRENVREGGSILVEVPNLMRPNPAKSLSVWLQDAHLYYFSAGTLSWLLAAAGFRAVRVEEDVHLRILARAEPSAAREEEPREFARVWRALARHEAVFWPARARHLVGAIGRRLR